MSDSESLAQQLKIENEKLKCEIDNLHGEIDSLHDEIDTLNENINEFYRPVDPYEYNGVRRSDFH